MADGLSPYVDAAPLEEQKYFLTTQQVDEARHAVFFNRFMTRSWASAATAVADGLNAIKPELTWGFTKVFDRLVTMSDELRRDPSRASWRRRSRSTTWSSRPRSPSPASTSSPATSTDRDLLPGFREGMEKVAADEQRHIGFGVKLLSDLREMDPEVPHAVADLLREVIPYTASVLVPPDWDMRYIECFGFTLEDIGEEGANSLETKMRRAGMPIEELPGPPVFPVPGTARERAERGSQDGARRLPRREARPAHARPGDMAAPVRDDRRRPRLPAPRRARRDPVGLPRRRAVARGRGQRRHPGAPGRVDDPTVTFSSRFEDFVDVSAGRAIRRKMAATRRLRPAATCAGCGGPPDVPAVSLYS